MRGPRFDQYELPSFRSILTSLGLWCVALITPVLAFYYLFLTETYAYVPLALLLIILCCGASYVLYKRHKEYVASYQARRDEAAIKIFNAVRSSAPLTCFS
jgi:Na+/melibiose symporter-like transporter